MFPPNKSRLPWRPRRKTRRRLKKEMLQAAGTTKTHIHISLARMLVLVFLGLVFLALSCLFAFMVSRHAIFYQAGLPLGAVIGGFLIIFIRVLYGDLRNNIKMDACVKCGHEMHPGLMFCGKCGNKRKLNL